MTDEKAPLLSFITNLLKPKEPITPPIEAQAAMALEPELIGPFLTRLTNNVRFRLPEELPELVVESLGEIPQGGRRKWKIDAAFDGRAIKIEMELYLDDPDTPELSFWTSKAAAIALDEELSDFADGLGPP